MSTFYLDYEAGSDAADGLSFANRWKTLTNGATAARIAPGDTIRIMGSPAPTSLGVNGTWTDGPLPATVSITSSTNATPIVITKAAHGLVTGDTVVITGHTTNTNANGNWEVTKIDDNTFSLDGSVGNGVGGATGTFRKVNCCRVMLATAVNKTIQKCDFQAGAWTASANVTSTIDTTDYRAGYGSLKLVIAAGFTTGLAAYKTLTALTDFSAYKQITFWIKQTAGTIGAAGAATLSLCSDTLGAVPVNTVNVPNLTALNQWVPVTVDTGGALSAVIQSVAFNIVTDNGAQTFFIDNIVACKDSTSADSLSLTSLIGKNTGNETWCAIQSIVDKRIMLDQGNNVLPTAATYRGYAGTTETVTAYKRETIKTALGAISTTSVQVQNDSGTAAGGYIYYEGGWDRTDMSTQTLETWFDGGNGLGIGIANTNQNYWSLNKVSFVRYAKAVNYNGGNFTILDNIHANNCSPVAGTGVIHFQSCYGNVINTIYSISYNTGTASGTGLYMQTTVAQLTVAHVYHFDGNSGPAMTNGVVGGTVRSCVYSDLNFNNNGGTGLQWNGGSECIVKGMTAKNGGASAMVFGGCDGNIVYDLVSSGNLNYGFAINGGRNYLVNASIAESTEASTTNGVDGYVHSQKHDTTTDNTQIFTDFGRISSTASVRHTASGVAWQMAVTNVNRTSGYPLRLSLATIMCEANKLFTFTAWFRRDNTGMTGRLMCKGGQISGVSADVSATTAAAVDTWEQLTISFTPTVTGGVEITAEAYGGSTYNLYVDDLDWTSA